MTSDTRIVSCRAWTVAVPFTNPIESAYGVSYPARIRVVIELTTADGVTGIGEYGPDAVRTVRRDDLAPAFERDVAPQLLGADAAHTEEIRARLGWSLESVGVELACLDIIGKATGRKVSELLGARSAPASVPVAAYAFFRRPDTDGKGGVTPDTMVEHVRSLVDRHGFDALKLKLGVYDPATEIAVVTAVREAFPSQPLRIDPNGAWSVGTALRVMRRLEDLDLEFVEDPIKDAPLGVGQQIINGRTVDLDGMRRLRGAARTPLCADNCYRLDLLRSIIREQAADVVLADVFGCGGLRATMRWFQTADLFHLGMGMHSGTELGVGQLAKLHVIAAMGGRVRHASDAIYPEYADDVLEGGPLPITGGHFSLPDAPGLGGTLDPRRLERWELTAQRHAELDAWWTDLRHQKGIVGSESSMLVRGW